jgi:hypothetical protein
MPLHRAEPVTAGAKRRAELLLRVVAVLPEVLVGETVWRIERRARLEHVGGEGAALSVAEGQAGTEAL